MGPEAPELDRPLEGGDEGARPVGGLHGAQLGEVGGQGGHPPGRRPLDEVLGDRTRGRTNAFSAAVLGRTARAGTGRAPP